MKKSSTFRHKRYQQRSQGGAGGYSPPIGLKSLQNTPFLALLRSIFALKTKIPPMVLAMGIGQGSDFDQKSAFQLG